MYLWIASQRQGKAKGRREINAQLRYALQEDRGIGFALDLALDSEDDGRNVVDIVWPGLDGT